MQITITEFYAIQPFVLIIKIDDLEIKAFCETIGSSKITSYELSAFDIDQNTEMVHKKLQTIYPNQNLTPIIDDIINRVFVQYKQQMISFAQNLKNIQIV